MTKVDPASRISVQTFAESSVPISAHTPLGEMTRLALETVTPETAGESAAAPTGDASVNWTAQAELRAGSAASPDIWLHLQADTTVSVTCQRCLDVMALPIGLNRWYRFVENEDVAMAQDNEAEEDLLVLETQFDLLALLEDELIMAMPMLPMHDVCPSPPQLQAGHLEGQDNAAGDAPARPHPFAALAGLKKNGQGEA